MTTLTTLRAVLVRRPDWDDSHRLGFGHPIEENPADQGLPRMLQLYPSAVEDATLTITVTAPGVFERQPNLDRDGLMAYSYTPVGVLFLDCQDVEDLGDPSTLAVEVETGDRLNA